VTRPRAASPGDLVAGRGAEAAGRAAAIPNCYSAGLEAAQGKGSEGRARPWARATGPARKAAPRPQAAPSRARDGGHAEG